MFHRIWLISIAVCIAAPAFAQEAASTQPAAPVPATPAPASTPTAATPAKVDAEPAPAESAAPTDGKLDPEKIMAAQKAGYSIRNEGGQTLLCRKEMKTGSRVRSTVSCMTAREWEQLQSDTSQSLRAIERRRPAMNNK